MRLAQRDLRQTGIAVIEVNGKTIQVPLFSEDILTEIASLPVAHKVVSAYVILTLEQQLSLIQKSEDKNGIPNRATLDEIRSGISKKGYFAAFEQQTHLSLYQ